jgi:hypothetical protein
MDMPKAVLSSYITYNSWLFGKNNNGVLSYDSNYIALTDTTRKTEVFRVPFTAVSKVKITRNVLQARFGTKKYYITFNNSAMLSATLQRPIAIEAQTLKNEQEQIILNSDTESWKILLQSKQQSL